jgi:cell division septation protein DedD
VIFGAALVLLASYAPSVFDQTVGTIRQQVAPPAAEITFDFPDMLEQDTVIADPSAYPAEFPDEDPEAQPKTYVIQAASLRASGAAAALSAELRTAGLSATWERVDIDSGTWYRVMVGPFDNQVEANRALTLLRKRNLGARLIRLS